MMKQGDKTLNVSVVVPCYNAATTLGECLDALLAQSVKPFEVIVVDDASTDDSVRIAVERESVRVVSLPFNSGAAAARAAGAGRTAGDVIMFVDADVALRPDAIEKALERLSANDKPDAIVGMYGARAPGGDFYSVAHNYFTVYNHSRQEGPIQWFWGAIGMVRKDAFKAVGGFDQRRYSGASAEDIELGFRMTRADYRIIIDHSIVGDHLVRFSLSRILHNDFRKSALGVQLFIEENRRLDQKHGFASLTNGASVALAAFSVLGAIAWVVGIVSLTAALLPPAIFYIVNLPYLRYLKNQEGIAFTVKAAVLHLASFIAIACGAPFGYLQYIRDRK